MTVLLEIKDSKAPFVMELLDNFSFVKAKPITEENVLLLHEIKEVADIGNLVNNGRSEVESLEGRLHSYANPALWEKEKHAWENNIVEKYDNI